MRKKDDKRTRRRPTEKREKYIRIKEIRQERQDFEEFEKPRFWRSFFCYCRKSFTHWCKVGEARCGVVMVSR